MDQSLLKIVESIGLRSKEAKVYLALLELTTGTVTQIAKITELKRSVIYVILDELIEKGYASILPQAKINKYQPIDPSVIFNKQKVTLMNFSEMLPLLLTLQNKGKSRPKIQYIDTKEGIYNIYESLNFAEEAIYISSYAQIDKHFNCVEQWIKGYQKKKYKVKARHLIPNNPEDVKYGRAYQSAGQDIRVLKDISHCHIDFTLTENKLAITSLEAEPFLVLIESAELAASLKPLFEIIWSSASPVSSS